MKTDYKSYKEVKMYISNFNLKSKDRWFEFTQSENFPDDIPKDPYSFFKRRNEWESWDEFLGNTNSTLNRTYISFNVVKEFVKENNITSQKEWRNFTKNSNFPNNIPKNIEQYFKKTGEWKSWSDFLFGYNCNIILSLEELKQYVRNFNFKSSREWYDNYEKIKFINNNNIKHQIPKRVDFVYKNKGWISWDDFLGTNNSTWNKTYITFDKAKEYVLKLEFKSIKEWKNYTTSSNFPDNIPKSPDVVYKKIKSWTNWNDFLGHDNTQQGRIFRSYLNAKEYILKLELKSTKEWKNYTKSSNFPNDLPKHPDSTYEEWISWDDFLGNNNSTHNKTYKSYYEVKKYVSDVNILNKDAWFEHIKIEKFPDDIPKDPYGYYSRKNMWVSWGDFLGRYNVWYKSNIIHFFNQIKPQLSQLSNIDLLIIIKSSNMLNAYNNLPILQELVEADPSKREEIVNKLEDLLDEDYSIEEDDFSMDSDNSCLSSLHSNYDIYDENTNRDVLDQKEIKGIQPINSIDDLKVFDQDIYSRSFDDETVEYFVCKQVNQLWQDFHTNKNNFTIEELRNDTTCSKIFEKTRERFLEIYDGAMDLGNNLPDSYIFPYKPSAMQLATAYQIIHKKYYGNFSGTGAGKTLSATLSMKFIDAKITVIICFNSTIEGWKNSINSSFSDIVVYDNPNPKRFGDIDLSKNNVLIFNYEKFQQSFSEDLIKALLTSFRIDFIILDEIQFVKQRKEGDKHVSARRANIKDLRVKAQELNPELRVLGMTATPIINNITEGKYTLELILSKKIDDVDTRPNIFNGIALHKLFVNNGIRVIPYYKQTLTETTIDIDANDILDNIIAYKKGKSTVLGLEQILLSKKLNYLIDNKIVKIGEKVILYSKYVEGIVEDTFKLFTAKGFKCSIYNGDDKSGLSEFINDDNDILICSDSIATGVDGLQHVCNKMIILNLPWTSALWEQLKGRLYRQGSLFNSVDIIIPKLNFTHNNKIWSWDNLMMKRITNKKEWADLVMDGEYPSDKLPSHEEMLSKALEQLELLISKEEYSIADRPLLTSDLDLSGFDISGIKYYNELSDFSKLNKEINKSSSFVISKKLNTHSYWINYHKLYSDARKEWKEIPYRLLGKTLSEFKNIDSMKIADFGCGENLIKKEFFPNHKLFKSFDHYAIDNSVEHCDISETSLKDDSMNIVICSLSLMSLNYKDYLKEAYRVLIREESFGSTIIPDIERGKLLIAEPVGRWSDKDLRKDLKKDIECSGFKINSFNESNNFIYVVAEKI